MRSLFRIAINPVPEPERLDTSLRYTDILFGFVIRELFLRLQNWTQLDRATHWHLVVGTFLVLGSWIGFRRSLNRSSYQIKCFNLPFLRFLVDQLMLILYFRIAVLTSTDLRVIVDAGTLAASTMELVLYIFALYVIWDLLAMWMSIANVPGTDGQKRPRYPALNGGNKMTEQWQRADLVGFLISFGIYAILYILWLFLWFSVAGFNRVWIFLVLTILFLVYRWIKDLRTSWRLTQ